MKVYGIILLIIFYAVHTNAQAQPHFPNKKYPADPITFILVLTYVQIEKKIKKFMPLKMDIFPELKLRKVDLAMPFILTMPVAIHPFMPI